MTAYFSGRQQLVYVTISIVIIAYVTLVLYFRNQTNSLLAPGIIDKVLSQRNHKKHPQNEHINQLAHCDQMASYGITVGASPGSTTNSQVPELFKVSNILQSWHNIPTLS